MLEADTFYTVVCIFAKHKMIFLSDLRNLTSLFLYTYCSLHNQVQMDINDLVFSLVFSVSQRTNQSGSPQACRISLGQLKSRTAVAGCSLIECRIDFTHFIHSPEMDRWRMILGLGCVKGN